MNKDRQIISELRNIFTENGCGLGIQRIMNVLGTINITERQMAFEKKPNCKFTCKDVVKYIRRKGSRSHLLGMIKMSKTKYTVAGEDMTARAIASARVNGRLCCQQTPL